MIDIDKYSIFIKHDKTYCIYNIDDSITLNSLKYMISKKINIPVHQFYIVCSGKIIDNIENIKENPTIEDYNKTAKHPIEKDRTIFVNIHSYDNFYKKIAYFFYENRCELINIQTNNSDSLHPNHISITIRNNR